jgi:hypothetical protein
VIGLIDITDPRAPKPLGNIDMSGEPTTAVFAQGMIFAGVNTSESFTNPSGKLVTVDPATWAVTAECDIGGQPDAVAKAPDGSFLAIAIENERDEDAGDGGLPQMPAGYVVKIAVDGGVADCAGQQRIDLTGLADVFVNYDMNLTAEGKTTANGLKTTKYISQNKDGPSAGGMRGPPLSQKHIPIWARRTSVGELLRLRRRKAFRSDLEVLMALIFLTFSAVP